MNTLPRKNFSIFLLLAGTLFVGFSMGRWLFPLIAWVGPVLLLRFSRDHKRRGSYLLLVAANILAFIIGYIDIWVGAGWPLPLIAALPVFYGILWSLPYLADRLAGRKFLGFLRTLVYPLTATTIEFVNNHANPIGAWGMTGFTQYGNLPLMQLASVTGMIGITFLMGWFASVANWVWEKRLQGKEMLRGLSIFGIFFIAVFLYGFFRLNLASSGETVRVAGITARPQDSFNEQLGKSFDMKKPDLTLARQVAEDHWNAYFYETEREARAGAKIIIWPEVSAIALSPDENFLTARAQDVARKNEIYLILPLGIVPADINSGELMQNVLLVIDPTGTIVMKHVKYGGYIFEGYRTQGDGTIQTIDTPFGVLSGAICWDMDYPLNIQQTGQKGVGLLMVPARDWQAVGPLHSRMAEFRAIENGMSIVRQTDLGLSIAVDAYGRVLAQNNFFSSTDRTMVAQIPVNHVTTIYTAFGHWFEWMCLFGFLAFLIMALFTKPVEGD